MSLVTNSENSLSILRKGSVVLSNLRVKGPDLQIERYS